MQADGVQSISWIENDKRDEDGSGIEGSGRTFFDKKVLALSFRRTNHKNSKVSISFFIFGKCSRES